MYIFRVDFYFYFYFYFFVLFSYFEYVNCAETSRAGLLVLLFLFSNYCLEIDEI